MKSMKTTTRLILAAIAIAAFGVGSSETLRGQEAAKKVGIGPKKGSENIFFEISGDKRRVLVNTKVCLRQGQLEQLLTRKRTKEHEAILVADIDVRDLHYALLLTGAEPGSPVTFLPKFLPPSGTVIKITLEYKENGKIIRRPAQDWIRDAKTKKALSSDWVFAGSRLFKNP